MYFKTDLLSYHKAGHVGERGVKGGSITTNTRLKSTQTHADRTGCTLADAKHHIERTANCSQKSTLQKHSSSLVHRGLVGGRRGVLLVELCASIRGLHGASET